MNKKERQLAYERERKAMNDLAMREFDRERAIEAIHKEHIETMQGQIDGFYMRYADSEGLTRAEAMKRADQMDVTKFANKAKKAVKEKDFSPETNEWLKTYNLKMKVSRLELLKEELNWELIQMYDKDYQLISESLREEARLELERQAGILGDSVSGARQRIDGIVNSDFYGKNFSERIWDRTGMYQSTQKEVFKSLSRIYTTMDGYRSERNRLMDKMQTTEYETMRLLRTENARIGSQMQVEAYKENEFTHFIYVAEPSACDVCKPLDGKMFKVEDAQIGLNLKPMHPNCYCSSYGYIAMERIADDKQADEATGEVKFEQVLEGVDFTKSRRTQAKQVLENLGLEDVPVSVKKASSRGYCRIDIDQEGKATIAEYVLESTDDRSSVYQTKTLFHEAYHATGHNRLNDMRSLDFGSVRWLDIEETFAETSAHYAILQAGINEKIAPAYSNKLVNILPRLKQTDKFKDAKFLSDFGEIAWDDRLNGTASTWLELAKEVEAIDYDWIEYSKQYKDYITKNRDKLMDKMLENMPKNDTERIRGLMLEDLHSALDKVENGEEWFSGNEQMVYSNILSNAMNEIGVK